MVWSNRSTVGASLFAIGRYAVLRLVTLNRKPGPRLAHRHQLEAVDVDVRRRIEHPENGLGDSDLSVSEIVSQPAIAGRQMIRRGRRHILPAHFTVLVTTLIPATRMQ